MSRRSCCVCSEQMQTVIGTTIFECPSCGTWASNLPIRINEVEARSRLDEDRREVGLAEVRERNLKDVARKILECGLKPGDRILEVGSAHGWFLSIMDDCGFEVEGVEPDEGIMKGSLMEGAVRVGLFPDVLNHDDRYSAICFNDVLEHLPDVDAAIEACFVHLEDGGLLSVNIPNRKGLIFRSARILARFGVNAPFDRLWQVGLASPHLWYFGPQGLAAVAARHGFILEVSRHLSTLSRSGLWHRFHMDRKPGIGSVLGFAAVWMLAPLFNQSWSSDIMHLVFSKEIKADQSV